MMMMDTLNIGEEIKWYTNKCSKGFNRLGKLKDTQIILHVDFKIILITQQYRRIQEKSRRERSWLARKKFKIGIIKDVKGPNIWKNMKTIWWMWVINIDLC